MIWIVLAALSVLFALWPRAVTPVRTPWVTYPRYPSLKTIRRRNRWRRQVHKMLHPRSDARCKCLSRKNVVRL